MVFAVHKQGRPLGVDLRTVMTNVAGSSARGYRIHVSAWCVAHTDP